jgi:hypothetical protein
MTEPIVDQTRQSGNAASKAETVAAERAFK